MSASKQKGTAFETLVVDYLRLMGWSKARRNPPAGRNDVGDIDLGEERIRQRQHPQAVLECKNVKTAALGAWVEEARREAVVLAERYLPEGAWLAEETPRSAIPPGVVIHKRRGRGRAEEQFVTMDLETFVVHFL